MMHVDPGTLCKEPFDEVYPGSYLNSLDNQYLSHRYLGWFRY